MIRVLSLRSRLIGIAVLALTFSGFNFTLQAQPISRCEGDDCRTIDAGRVTADVNNGLTGTFTVKESHTPYAIHSSGNAGACLFVESSALKLPADWPVPSSGRCESDSDCGRLQNSPIPGDPAKWEGVCHKEDGSCWIRPGGGFPLQSAVCNKGVMATNDVPVKSNIPPFDPSTLQNLLTEDAIRNKHIKVRILACLNGNFVDSKPPCAGNPGEKIMKFGSVSVISLKP